MKSALMMRVLWILALVAFTSAASGGVHKSHAITLYDETPKYAADFPHFDYVRPDAPKGGVLRIADRGTFDSFHAFIPKGNAADTGSTETLLTPSDDEPYTQYGLIAETIEWPDDRSWVIFNLRPEAKWHDGMPITAGDVAWSFEVLIKKGSPQYRYYYSNVEKVEALSERRVKFSFSERNNRELPMIVGQLPILPKHYWAKKDFEKTTLEPPLGSGPYRVKEFEAGRFIVQERVKGYWGKSLAVNKGFNNFDRKRIGFYRDTTAIRLALKSGGIDYRHENQAKAWAVDYVVPAVEKGWLKMERVDHSQPKGMQGFVFNTRREIFSNPKVREALSYAFDFEWTNRNLFFGQYTRTQSFFSNSTLATNKAPNPRELALFKEYRGRVPERIIQEVYKAPSTDGDGWPRENLLKADRLLKEAGWVVRDFKRVHESTGKTFIFEFLLYSVEFERIILPMKRNLKRLGIDVKVRLVDQAQYINRLRSFDFDMVLTVWGQSNNPGNEQRNYWASEAADQPSSLNLAGIKDPVVDDLLDRLVIAQDRDEMGAIVGALDRILLFSFYVIPNWHLPADRVLYWDKFDRPKIATQSGVMINRWWFDKQKVTQLEKAIDQDQEFFESTGDETPSVWRWIVLFAVLFVGWLMVQRYLKGQH